MAIQILGGCAKGMSLDVPLDARPTLVLLRRRLFDAHQDMSGRVFVDLCAGSGAMGLEALSRGADATILVESQREAYAMIQKNCENFFSRCPDLSSGKARPMLMTAERWLPRYLQSPDENVVLFFDPPYDDLKCYETTLRTLLDSTYRGVLWLESDRVKGLSRDQLETILGAHQRHVRKWVEQGTSYVAIVDF